MARIPRGLRYLEERFYNHPTYHATEELKLGHMANNMTLVGEIASRLPYLDYDETRDFYNEWRHKIDNNGAALLACNDRYYLLTELLDRIDLYHPWLFDRCREVENAPDGHIDLWARGHGKSSIITTGGVIQEVLIDPELTVAIFSVVKPTAVEFLGQIKTEFENNDLLKECFPDVLYVNPRGKDPVDGSRPAKWGLARGITVKRKGKPKEATVEAHGLIDGQPTGRHFKMHVYDDVVTQDYLSDEQLKKCTLRFEMADNLGTRLGVRKWIVGTRYHFADTYGGIIKKGSAIPRIYAATEDGTLIGRLVLLTPENWARIKRDQSSAVSAQMLLNPLAGNEATFKSLWLKFYDVIPAVMNVYILVDPSKGSGDRSDRTAIAVVGIDQQNNKFLLDGVRHRMKLSDRFEFVNQMKRKWENHPGVQLVKVGWERYGKDVEVEVIEDMQRRQDNVYEIHELNTPRQGGHSKNDRIERLEPDIRDGRFYFPAVAHHPDRGGDCYVSIWGEAEQEAAKLKEIKHGNNIGEVVFRPRKGLTKLQRHMVDTAQRYRVVEALKRRDENNDVYDLTRCFIEEMINHPFATHDDLIDAVSRIYDIEPLAPAVYEAQSTEPIGIENDPTGGGE